MDGVTDAGLSVCHRPARENRMLVLQNLRMSMMSVTDRRFAGERSCTARGSVPSSRSSMGKDPDSVLFGGTGGVRAGVRRIGYQYGLSVEERGVVRIRRWIDCTPELARTIMQAAKRGIEEWAGGGQTLEQAGFKAARVAMFERLNRERGKAGPTPRRLLPLSVKTRLGYDSVAVEEWVEELLREQPTAISLHGRTLRQMYRGTADWSAIGRAAALARGTGTLLLGNGTSRTLTTSRYESMKPGSMECWSGGVCLVRRGSFAQRAGPRASP